jgi:hypothetical protein
MITEFPQLVYSVFILGASIIINAASTEAVIRKGENLFF